MASPAPAAPSVPSLDFTMDMELVDEPGEPEAIVAGRGRGAKVLLVEDEEPLRRVMKDLLEREGYLVAEARDGVQALDEVDRHAPDIIVLDLNLPGLDGYSVLQQLRSRAATRTIPVMVLTAKGDEDNEVRVFELGADDFITKPFRARALSARLEDDVAIALEQILHDPAQLLLVLHQQDLGAPPSRHGAVLGRTRVIHQLQVHDVEREPARRNWRRPG